MANANASNAEPETLTARERKDLDRYERQIEQHETSYIGAGKAFVEIQGRRLHRETHEKFSSYCRDRHGHSDRYARYLIDSARVATALKEAGTNVPPREGQARALVPLLDDPEKLVRVYQAEWERRGRAPTARELRTAIQDAPIIEQVEAGDLGAQFRIPADRAVHRIEKAMEEITNSIRGMYQTDRDGFPAFAAVVAESLRAIPLPNLSDTDWWRPLLDLDGADDSRESRADVMPVLTKKVRTTAQGSTAASRRGGGDTQ